MRNACLARQPRSPPEVRQRALQTARALHNNDAIAMERETRRWLPLRRLLQVEGGKIWVRDQDGLDALLG